MKLTASTAAEIRMEAARGVRHLALAQRFGVSEGMVSHVVTGRNWFPYSRRSQAEDRRRALLRNLPCTSFDLALARPDWWGGGATSAGVRRRYRDLAAVGAVNVNGVWTHGERP